MVQKQPKMGLKRPKRHQNDAKMIPRCPKLNPDRPKNGPKSPKNHPKMVLFWSYFGLQMGQKVLETTRKTGPKGAKSGQKWPRNQAGMFNSVQRHSKSTYGTTGHIQFTYRSVFVKCQFKGDTSKTGFRSLCKIAFLAPRTGHTSSYSCPFALVPSPIDSSKCPLQNRG